MKIMDALGKLFLYYLGKFNYNDNFVKKKIAVIIEESQLNRQIGSLDIIRSGKHKRDKKKNPLNF